MREAPRETNSVAHQIRDAISKAYAHVGDKHGIDEQKVYSIGWCKSVTDAAQEELSQEFKDRMHRMYSPGGWVTNEHYFFAIDEDGEEWIVDPTWQQFRDEVDENLPKVLWAKASQIEQLLTQYGIPKEKHPIWTRASREINEHVA